MGAAVGRAVRKSLALGLAIAAGLLVSGVLLRTGVASSLGVRVAADGARNATIAAPDPQVTHTENLMGRFGCSTTGLGHTIPAHAIVRTSATGKVRLVSFSRGWAAYQGQVPGVELVAVCAR